ncbi:fibrinogen-like protein A isoform X1 [Crassostrea virginica]
MLYHATGVLLGFLSLYILVETSDICRKPNGDNNINGKKLTEFPIKIFPNIGLQSCYKECQAHGNCFSANYDRNQLTCQLMDKTKSQLNPLIDAEHFIYMEMTDTVGSRGKTCGDIVCNNHSTCIRTLSGKITCIKTDCAEPYPLLDNGGITERTFSPISATYGCNPGLTGVGSGKRITCRPGGKWSALSYRCETPDHDCSAIIRSDPDMIGHNGVFTISSYPNKTTAYCDMTTKGGGWTVIQNRVDGSTDFYRTWREYSDGFGNTSNNYWIGNDMIHQLTKNETQVLRVELERFNGEKGYAEYSTFIVGDELSKYKLTVSGYNGTIGDNLSYHSGSMFSTRDQDNDYRSDHCSQYYHGAWWYYSCHLSNLNGKYMGPGVFNDLSMNWKWASDGESLKSTRMMIRPLSF